MLKNKIIKLLVGTNNKGKLKEIRNLLPKNLEIYSPKDFKMKSPPENGKTFKENSLIKAKFFSKKAKMTCLSDDSGLEIDALNGDPGIYSARWGGKKGDFKKAMNRVFKELDKKMFTKKTLFKGKVGIFEIKNNKINHILNFYKVEDGEFKKVF